ncbi:MAG: hypothetical protein ACC662_06320 [Planctomycetota bacterium]
MMAAGSGFARSVPGEVRAVRHMPGETAMTLDWNQLRTAVARGLHSANEGNQGSVRIHCKAAERMLKGAKDGNAPQILDHVHHAATSLDATRAAEYLQKAVELFPPAQA